MLRPLIAHPGGNVKRWAQPYPVYASDLFVTLSSDNGATWSTPQLAIGSARNEMHPALAQLAPDSFALFYLVDETDGGSYRLHRATSSDGLAWTDQGALDLGWSTSGEVITNTAWLTDAEGIAVALVATATGDILPPASTILDPLDGQAISSTSYLVTGTATDTVSGISAVSVSVDGGPWQMAAGREQWSWNWASLADGWHNLRSRAEDAVGHMEEPGPGITVTVDATPPAVLAHLPPAGAVDVPLSATVVLTFSERIVTGTLAYTITTGPGGWAASWNALATAVTLAHSDFAYAQAYTFTVLQARDRVFNPLAPVTWSFTTVPPPCTPVEVLLVTTVLSGCQVTFGAVVTGTEPLAYLWDFGFTTSTETNPLVDFGASGTYPYTLTVANCGGTQDVATGTVTVACAPPCMGPAGVDFAYAPQEPRVQATVYFSGSVLSGTAPFTYTWDFGDGGTAGGLYANHTFTATGPFTASLTVSNLCGDTTRQHAVRVVPYQIYLPIVGR